MFLFMRLSNPFTSQKLNSIKMWLYSFASCWCSLTMIYSSLKMLLIVQVNVLIYILKNWVFSLSRLTIFTTAASFEEMDLLMYHNRRVKYISICHKNVCDATLLLPIDICSKNKWVGHISLKERSLQHRND